MPARFRLKLHLIAIILAVTGENRANPDIRRQFPGGGNSLQIRRQRAGCPSLLCLRVAANPTRLSQNTFLAIYDSDWRGGFPEVCLLRSDYTALHKKSKIEGVLKIACSGFKAWNGMFIRCLTPQEKGFRKQALAVANSLNAMD